MSNASSRSADRNLSRPLPLYDDDGDVTGVTDRACQLGDAYFRVPGPKLSIVVILPGESNILDRDGVA